MQKYDYGKSGNREHYGTDYPPTINLNQVTGAVPIAMFVGTADNFGDTTDCRWARDQVNPVFYSEFPAGHASFMIGKNMTYVDDLISQLNKYNPV